MGKQRTDSALLVGIILAFGASVGVLASKVPSKQQGAADGSSKNDDAQYSTALGQIEQLLYSQSVDLLARLMMKFPVSIVQRLIKERVFSAQSPLEPRDKVEFTVALLHYYHRLKKDAAVISWVLPYQNLWHQNPLLFVAVQSPYASSLPALISSLKTEGGQKIFDVQEQAALDAAIRADDVRALVLLYRYGVPIDASKATVLLNHVAMHGQDPAFVSFLVQRGARVNEVMQGKTPLILATESANEPIVAALLECGADPNMIADPAVGSALQVAFERGFKRIEDILRDHGAHY